MSNLDLFTEKDFEGAATQGWTLAHVFDLSTNRWSVQILPLVISLPFHSADQAGAFVVSQARAGFTLATKALQLVMASHAPTARKKK